ncbi:MAG TPA: excinuclease ABC subunit C [Cytophagales bacterium]|nr:excinuclease ABC subunit C [Cytophagales bacterium]HAA18508.1 excinuclease ABC subunit C [Cytophagales bacterium]HAP58518.1 excinuclease ABC subunit C [Cytophagales bacterium]
MEIPRYKPDQVLTFPDSPGVYRFFNQENVLIYVGKAKSLKKRVASYFNKSATQSRKTMKMAREIAEIEFTLVNTEFDALLLENNLIKENQPKYNILLKDDKTFPFIVVTNERFPRIYSTRRVIPSLGRYFGPYASVRAMNSVLDLLRKLYKIRTCKFNLSEANIGAGKFKVCLEYHIGNCLGPCEGLQEEDNYQHDIESAINILKGNLGQVRSHFKSGMQEAAEQLAFEKAQEFKERLELLDKFQAKSLVVHPKISNVDVFTIVTDEKVAFVNFLKINEGTIINTQTVEVRKKLDETPEEILTLMVIELRDRFQSSSQEIITNLPLVIDFEGPLLTVPKIGDKKKLTELSIKNALFFKKERLNKPEDTLSRDERIMSKLQQDLQLKTLPKHIECFDNSNLGGTNPVASMVCFKNAKPSKQNYRHYNIKTVEGPNDFASMKEIVGRRYKRLLDEKSGLPDLVVVDGGKGQLSSAVEALNELGLYGRIPIVGIAKRLEEIYFPEDPIPLHIEKKSESLKLIQHMRDEAHRFAITFHRQKRSNSTFKTELEDIPGIGKKTADKLLGYFKSVQKVIQAPEEEIIAVIGTEKAKSVVSHFKNVNTK